jgi:hypothetical protein
VGAEERIAELEATVAALTVALAERDARIAELEEGLGKARRAGKRQAAPFSKGDPKPDPETAGRRRAKPMVVTVIGRCHRGRRTGICQRRCRAAARIVVARLSTCVMWSSGRWICRLGGR